MSEATPSGWDFRTLGDVTAERSDKVGPGRAPVVLSSTKHFGLVPSDDFFSNRQIYSSDLSNYKTVKRDWFAYATNHLAEGSVGIQDAYDLACVSPIYTVFSCRRDTIPGYLFRLLKWPQMIGAYQVHEQASVNRRGAVRYASFARIAITMPPPREQRRIAEILDSVDLAISSTERLIAKLTLTKQGLVYDLLTRGVDHDGSPRTPEDVGSVGTPPGQLPHGWTHAPLGERIVSIDAGHSPDVPDVPAAHGEWAVLKVSAVKPDGLQPKVNKALLDQRNVKTGLEIHDGDLLMTRANTPQLVGLACFVSDPPPGLLLSDKTLRLNLDSQRAVPRFVALALQSPLARRQIEVNGTGSSGSMKNISQEEIRNIVIAWPSPSEQAHIVERVEAASRRLDLSRQSLSKLKKVKLGLADDLLMGRVRVSGDEDSA
jgi:type I restriction enzyme S subunit